MILLHPLPAPFHKCPHCAIDLTVVGWIMPGMRVLADLTCEKCGHQYWGDLQAGHGLYYPMLLDKASGEVFDAYAVEWFADWLQGSYRQRTSREVPFTVEEFRPLRKVLLLNCLDGLYGHALLKLLNAQYYLDHCPEYDLIVIVPAFLRWMVPDGVAAIWSIGLPLRQGTEWNDWLAAEIYRRIETFDQAWISVAYSHPHAGHFDIERFTRVKPFNFEGWQESLDHPVVTFIWRDDRRWEGDGGARFRSRAERKVWRTLPPSAGQAVQQHKVTRLAESLRNSVPELEFAVVGPGNPKGFPEWIKDLRASKITDATEQIWCQQYARSHAVVGVHGSNMLLPSAQAATVINLLPQSRFGNSVQDILVTEEDARMALLRYRLVPLSSTVEEVASLLNVILNSFQHWRLTMAYEDVCHDPKRNSTLSQRMKDR